MAAQIKFYIFTANTLSIAWKLPLSKFLAGYSQCVCFYLRALHVLPKPNRRYWCNGKRPHTSVVIKPIPPTLICLIVYRPGTRGEWQAKMTRMCFDTGLCYNQENHLLDFVISYIMLYQYPVIRFFALSRKEKISKSFCAFARNKSYQL